MKSIEESPIEWWLDHMREQLLHIGWTVAGSCEGAAPSHWMDVAGSCEGAAPLHWMDDGWIT